MLRSSLIAIFTLLCLSLTAQAERVMRFHADIVLKADNYVEITEHIRIYAEGNIFKRGLRREIPLHRTDQFGHNKSMPIYLQEIKCNGKDSPWHSEDDEDLTIYIGDANTFLNEGEYEYTIRYIAPGHIAQFNTHDEIYWNLNGFGWNVPIDTLSATITIPDGTEVKRFFGFTGQLGDKGKDYDTHRSAKNKVQFTSTKTFSPGENMTIVVEFTKGSQKALTWWDIWKDDVYASGMTLAFILFCFFTWYKVGVDPKKPTVIPQYTVPKGISPALAGRIVEGSTMERLVVATLISMFIKGGAKIIRLSKKNYQLERGSDDSLDTYEKTAYLKLFSQQDKITTEYNDEELASMRDEIYKKVYNDFNSAKYYIRNTGYIVLATILGIALAVSFGGLDLLDEVLFACAMLAIIAYIWYVCIIGKYTPNGIRARAEMEGLKMYIETAESLEMRDLTPEFFEELLPYAIAFGVENKWCKQFQTVLEHCKYEPEWYNSYDPNLTYAYLLNDGGISSITKSFLSAAKSSFDTYDSAHSSSSGGSWSSGGGGFSGGGGGGGGGGGW